MLCFSKLPVAKKSMHRRGGYQDFPSKVFCTTMPKTLAREPFCVLFQKFPVAKKIKHKKGGYQDFPSKIFCIEVPKNRKETLLFCVSESFRQRKTLWIREGTIKSFRRKFFVPQCRKLWQGSPFVLCFRKLPVAEKILDKRGRGLSRFSVESFLYHNAKNFGKGALLCCVSENFQ